MEYIRLSRMPDEIATEAYNKGCFIEAIQVLHSYIENQSRSFLMLVGSVHFDAKLPDTWDLTDTIKFNDCIKILYILNQITKEEYNLHRSLNSLRNKIIHDYCKEPYEDIFKGIPKAEYDEVFNKTMDNLYFFSHKCEEIIEK